MNQTNRKIIDAIIQKAERICPDSLALIGLYGSAATGDTHPKSDLDLLILINDDQGWRLADGFILDDIGIGYDIYCTSWEMMKNDAECSHAHLSKLLNSQLVYVKDPSAVQRLEALRRKAVDLLKSDARFEKAAAALDNAKRMLADCFLDESVSQVRTHAGAAIHFLLDAVMLHHGRYFRMGVKRSFEELSELPLLFDMKVLVLNVIRSESGDSIRSALVRLFQAVQSHLSIPKNKATPCASNLSGTYEEMFSNWHGKMQEAADNGDLFSSFMNTASLQFMLREIAEHVNINTPDAMAGFDPNHLQRNAKAYDETLRRYLEEYRKIGIQPKHYPSIDSYLAEYLK